jgi:dTDP-glucose 4,6-dehydratase
MNRSFGNVLVTGGAGFIGSNFIHYLFRQPEFSGRVVNYDALTYAGNLSSLADVEAEYGGTRYRFVHGDICDRGKVEQAFRDFSIDTVVHFAAESHVDRSILDPSAFIRTNVLGTQVLLDAARNAWGNREDVLFHHISTDEVYGSLGEEGAFTEKTPYDPRSPYSASKAAADHLVMAYWHTYGLPVTLSNCSNNYGPFQFPEKLIPLMIANMEARKPLPVYGDGRNVRDWLYVEDHTAAAWTIMRKGRTGEKYNIGGETEWENLRLVKELCAIYAAAAGANAEEILGLITFVKDRPGHDRRYAIDCGKLKDELGWRPEVGFAEGLDRTVRWYLSNQKWVNGITTGEYKNWIRANYGER